MLGPRLLGGTGGVDPPEAHHMPSPRLLALAGAAALLIGTSTVGAPPASAKVRTSAGLTCTKVGTPRSDRMVGTSRRDVLCGRGGNDVILGGGGNDVIDGGPGNDSLSGSTGNDTIADSWGNDTIDGGAGNDTVNAGAGNDRVQGGTGNDRLVGSDGDDRMAGSGGVDVIDGGTGVDTLQGGSGNDRMLGGGGRDAMYGEAGADSLDGQSSDDSLFGGTDNDTIQGGTGSDSVAGGSGQDVMDGGSGNDTVSGQTGNDHLLGGDGDDKLRGEAGDDNLSGGAGNDDLDGGDGDDVLIGGAGTNWCDVESEDSEGTCQRDQMAPHSVALVVSPTRVDVSQGSVTVTADAHMVDDTGIVRAQVNSSPAFLFRGTARDGWWRARVPVSEFSADGYLELDTDGTDRVGRMGSTFYPQAVTVVGGHLNPDQDPPTVQSLQVDTDQVDVRDHAVTVTATLHITDDVVGVSWGMVYLMSPYDDGYAPKMSTQLSRISGTAVDGVYRVSFIVPEAAIGGPWNFMVSVGDTDQHWRYVVGPDISADNAARGLFPDQVFPDGAGRLSVTGSEDTNAPILDTVTVNPGSIDASAGARTVTVDVAAHDLEGVESVSLWVHRQLDAISPITLDVGTSPSSAPVSGTAQNGVWRFTVQVPGGAPAGRYPIQVRLTDANHHRVWRSYDATNDRPPVFDPAQVPNGDAVVVE
jgi:hypothetical protein